MLILKRATSSRPSGEWNDDDFDVLADDVPFIGRIFKAHAVTPSRRTCRIVQLTKFELVINAQTAKTLGLAASPSLLALATR